MAERQRPTWMGGGGSNQVWRWWWEDKDGYSEVVESRGPKTEGEMREAAQIILDAMTQTAIASGNADPGLRITDIQSAGYDNSPFGTFRPVGARPLNVE